MHAGSSKGETWCWREDQGLPPRQRGVAKYESSRAPPPPSAPDDAARPPRFLREACLLLGDRLGDATTTTEYSPRVRETLLAQQRMKLESNWSLKGERRQRLWWGELRLPVVSPSTNVIIINGHHHHDLLLYYCLFVGLVIWCL